jgi:hypothetical protein
MPGRDLGIAGKRELTEAPPLPPFAQMPANPSGCGLHPAYLAPAVSQSNYSSGNPFLTCDVIGFSPPVGDIQAGHHSGASMTEAEMDNLTELIDRYIAMWNETDAGRRRVLIAQTWTEDARYIDPMLQAEGQASIDAMICGVHERFPGHRFRRTSEPDAHHDRVRFAWELAPEGAPAVVKGTDFAVVADQRLRSVTGFFDQVASEARGD